MFKSSDGFRKFKDGLRGKLLWQYWQAFKSTAWEIFWGASVIDVTGEICTRWNERESTWRKSGSCQSRGTSQSRS